MDVMLTLAIGFLTTFLGFILTEFFGFDFKTLIGQLAAVNMIFPLLRMLLIYFTNPSGLAAWSNYYTNELVSQLPEEIVGEFGGVFATVLIFKIREISKK